MKPNFVDVLESRGNAASSPTCRYDSLDPDDKKRSRKASSSVEGGLSRASSLFLLLFMCVIVGLVLIAYTNRAVSASENKCKIALSRIEERLRAQEFSSYSASRDDKNLKEANFAQRLVSVEKTLDETNKRLDEVQNSQRAYKSSGSSDQIKSVKVEGDLSSSLATLSAKVIGLELLMKENDAKRKEAQEKVDSADRGGQVIVQVNNENNDVGHVSSVLTSGGGSEHGSNSRLDSLQRLVEQAHRAIKDVNDRLKLYEQVEISIKEMRRIIGMPEMGVSSEEADKEQQRILAEIAERQAKDNLHQRDPTAGRHAHAGNRLRHALHNPAGQRQGHGEFNPHQQHHHHHQAPSPEKAKLARDIMAENYQLQKEQEELRRRARVNGEAVATAYDDEESNSGGAHARGEFRKMNPEDSHYDQYHDRYDGNNNKKSAQYDGDAVPPQGLQANYGSNNPYGAFNPGQTRLPVINPLADVVDPLKRSVKQAEMVKREMASAWRAYKRYAWGHDELKPVSNTYHDWGGSNSKGVGLTAVDSLSAFWLMGMHAEFDEAMNFVTEEADFNQNIRVSVFEYTIRVVGGLLSAYELSGESYPKLLSTAQRVMDKLLVAYNTSTGLPHQTCNLRNKKHWSSDWSQGSAILSEFGTVQLELRTLSYHTKNPVYDIKATHITDIMESQCRQLEGLCPTFFDSNNGQPRNDQITLGALGDSYYEYLLKQYILTGRQEERYKRMALEALDSAIDKLLQYSSQSRQAYFADITDGMIDMKMDHLACFTGGLYALAADTFPDHKQVKTYRKVAEGITKTCNQMYEKQLSGLAPEYVVFTGGMDFVNGEPYNILRPEVVESIFYMWRYTKDQKYRDMAWEIFLRFMAYCKTPSGGYSGVQIVTMVPPEQDDMMQSFFLSETLKYLYLIFSEDEVLDLDSWVLNTEAHPLKIRARDPLDVWREWEVHHSGVPAFMPPTVPGVKIRTETERMKKARGSDPIIPRRDPLGSDEEPPGEGDGYPLHGAMGDHNGAHY